MRQLAAAVAAVTVLATATACGSGSSQADPPTPDQPSATSSDATPSTDPEATSTPGVEPATGARLDMPHSSVRIPADWRKEPQLVSTQKDAIDPDSASTMKLGEVEAFGADLDADELATLMIKTDSQIYPLRQKRMPNVTIGGVEMYHLSGKVDRHLWVEEYGAIVDDRTVTLTMRFDIAKIPPAEGRELFASVAATLTWK